MQKKHTQVPQSTEDHLDKAFQLINKIADVLTMLSERININEQGVELLHKSFMRMSERMRTLEMTEEEWIAEQNSRDKMYEYFKEKGMVPDEPDQRNVI